MHIVCQLLHEDLPYCGHILCSHDMYTIQGGAKTVLNSVCYNVFII